MTILVIIGIVLLIAGILSESEDLSDRDDQELIDELNRRSR